MTQKNAWEIYSEAEKAEVFRFSEGYKEFLSAKTERECVAKTIELAKAQGYRDLKDIIAEGVKLQAGDKVYANGMDKTLMLLHIGTEPFEKGLKILGAHIDSPRIDLKQHPLYEKKELAFFDTHYYGGIKKYQWVATPLALHGVVVKKDGTVVDINIGEKDDEPVVGVSDLLIHLAGTQMEKPGSKVVEGEDLNILVGSIPLEGEEKESAKAYILKVLKETYDIEEEDFISAEIEAVPAGAARDYGLDRSMIMGYGHDDRVCAYPSALAVFDIETPDRTAVCILTDKEEVGSIGATGAQSRFFENTVAEVMNAAGQYNELALRRTLSNSRMLSSDVSAAYDPNYFLMFEENNSAYFGHGVCFNKYTGARGKSGCNDANAEYMAALRKIMDDNNVVYQTAELGKVDQGGGGTIAYILANYGMEVIDSGVAVQNMHAPWEVISKADLYEAYKGYKAFLKDA